MTERDWGSFLLVLSSGWLSSYVGQSEVPALITSLSSVYMHERHIHLLGFLSFHSPTLCMSSTEPRFLVLFPATPRGEPHRTVFTLTSKTTLPPGTSALTVKFADSEKEKKKRQKLKQSLGRLNMMGAGTGFPAGPPGQMMNNGGNGNNMNGMGMMGMQGQGGKGGRGGPMPPSPERKASGPPGANCFILHLPLTWTDEILREVCIYFF